MDDSRIKRLQEELKEKNLDMLIIEDKIDLYYLIGAWFSAGRLLLGKTEALFLVDGRYSEIAGKIAPCPIAHLSWEETRQFAERIAAHSISFDGAKMSYSWVEELKKHCALYDFVSWSFPTRSLRVIKDPEEVRKLQKSAALLWKGYEHILENLTLGVREKDLATAFTIFCLQKGAEGLSFEPIIAFGENSSLPHHRAGTRALKEGDTVLIDIGVSLDGYASDMTRVTFFGSPNPLIQQWLEITKEAQRRALSLCRPGVRCKEIDQAAREVFRSHDVEKYFVHGLGHGVGIEVHEFPRIRSDGPDVDVLLEPGMILTIEPGLYLPGTGGVRYEDTICITENGYINFFS